MMETSTRPPQEKVCGYEYTVKRGDSFYLIAHRLGVPLRDLLEANADINPARLMVGDVLCIPMEEDDAPSPGVQTPAQTPIEPTQEPAQEPAAPEAVQNTPEIVRVAPEPTPAPVPETVPETAAAEPAVPQPTPEPILEENLDTPASDPSAGVSAEASSGCADGSRHTVVEGETAADIQLDAGLSLHTLQSANPTADLDRLTAGQVLCIPDKNVPCPTVTTYVLQAGETLESVALRLNLSLGALLRANPCLAPADFTEGMCVSVPD